MRRCVRSLWPQAYLRAITMPRARARVCWPRVLSPWRGDSAHARARALAACTTAEMAGLAWHQGWAAWHMGCLAAASGELDDALAYFGRAVSAAEAINDAVMIELLCLAEALILRQRELRSQREYHRQAYFAAEQAEREVIERLRVMFA